MFTRGVADWCFRELLAPISKWVLSPGTRLVTITPRGGDPAHDPRSFSRKPLVTSSNLSYIPLEACQGAIGRNYDFGRAGATSNFNETKRPRHFVSNMLFRIDFEMKSFK